MNESNPSWYDYVPDIIAMPILVVGALLVSLFVPKVLQDRYSEKLFGN